MGTQMSTCFVKCSLQNGFSYEYICTYQKKVVILHRQIKNNNTMATTLLNTTTRTNEDFISFVNQLKDCKLNNFEHWNYFLAYHFTFNPKSVWGKNGVYQSLVDTEYTTRGVNIEIYKALNQGYFLPHNCQCFNVKIELDNGKLILSGEGVYPYCAGFNERTNGIYRCEISFIEEMWTSDGHTYLGGKVIPITQEMLNL
jgi:hypothetical protein